MAKTKVDPKTLTAGEKQGNYQSWTGDKYAEVRNLHGAVVKRFSGTKATEMADQYALDLHLLVHV